MKFVPERDETAVRTILEDNCSDLKRFLCKNTGNNVIIGIFSSADFRLTIRSFSKKKQLNVVTSTSFESKTSLTVGWNSLDPFGFAYERIGLVEFDVRHRC